MITPRIYLAGRVAIEHDVHFVDERRLSGRQSCLAFAFLVAERHRPIGRDEIVSVLAVSDELPLGACSVCCAVNAWRA